MKNNVKKDNRDTFNVLFQGCYVLNKTFKTACLQLI